MNKLKSSEIKAIASMVSKTMVDDANKVNSEARKEITKEAEKSEFYKLLDKAEKIYTSDNYYSNNLKSDYINSLVKKAGIKNVYFGYDEPNKTIKDLLCVANINNKSYENVDDLIEKVKQQALEILCK